MDLLRNSLIVWKSDVSSGLNRTERVLSVNPSKDEIWVIEMIGPNGMPERESLSRYQKGLASGLATVSKNDIWFRSPQVGTETAASAARDRNWELIREIAEHPKGLSKKVRSRLIRKAAEGTSLRKIYELLRRYWRGGQTRESLAPKFDLRGGPGKARNPRSRKGQVGKEITDEDRELMTRGFEKFYARDTRPSLSKAYARICAASYSDGLELADGKPVPRLMPGKERPSLRQFKYHCRRLLRLPKTARERMGDRKFDLTKRDLPGRYRSNGPGSTFMIDATQGDIYLASSYKVGESVGRATIYLVVDHFSGAVAGFHIGLEAPSARMAGLALANAATDKVAWATRYGVEISSEDWPCQHLPAKLLADQGELRGPIAEPWINELGLEIRQTPTNRADLKGTVERCLQSLGRDVLEGLPGYVERDRARRDKDPARYAKVTLHELTCQVIRWAVEYNTRPRTGILNDNLPAEAGLTPAKLWAWGVVNRGADLKVVPQSTVEIVALPKAEARIKRGGIIFRGITYWCEEAEEGEWGFCRRGEALVCHYDPNDATVLHLVVPGGHVRCHIRHENDIAHGRGWDEINLIRRIQTEQAREDGETSLQRRVARETHIRETLKTKPKGRGSKKNIDENRELEITTAKRALAPALMNYRPERGHQNDPGELAAQRLAILQE